MEEIKQYKERCVNPQLKRYAIDLSKHYAKRAVNNQIENRLQKTVVQGFIGTTAKQLSRKTIARANLAFAVIDAGISVVNLYFNKKKTREIRIQCETQKDMMDIESREIKRQIEAQVLAEKEEMNNKFLEYKAQLEHFTNEISRFETEYKKSQSAYKDLKLTICKQKDLMNTLNTQIEKFAELCKFSKEYIMYCDRYKEELNILSNLIAEMNNM